ncbi:DUF6531 domain-containing protein [Aquabacterium sp. A7-Y]|uniref:DUF6531 domain-containing protein n=1 Tax=Aquabacterium sp. A7-Y TaxID=1349605 RepID=UPI00223E0350|nr:DUF6531 domain-containing protein [Aquabacterium sp. A7-Y]MCW7536264.1 DUF6531 domain-containing protein [Aquabacterium sp. A7-Y]
MNSDYVERTLLHVRHLTSAFDTSPAPALSSHSHRISGSSGTALLLSLAAALLVPLPAWAIPGDEVCFPLYRKAGAIPGTRSCPLTASTAPVSLATYFCTASSGADIHIPRYCGTIPKNFGDECDRTPRPIAIGSGNKSLRESDYSTASPRGLNLTRYYNSTPAAAPGALFGASWRSALDARVVPIGEQVAAYRPDGRIVYFKPSGDAWVADADVDDRLQRLPATGTLTGWRYRDIEHATIEQYDADGRLVEVHGAAGDSWELAYSSAEPTPGDLTTMRDHVGRTLRFSHDSEGRVTQLTLPGGTVLRYSYDARSNLEQVVHTDGKQRRYVYNESARTAGTELPHALTGLIDEKGVRHASYGYDAQGRAIEEVLHASGDRTVGRYAVAYQGVAGPDAAMGESRLTDPLNATRTYRFENVLGVARRTALSQPAGAGCAAATSHMSYDARGNVRSRDDFNGKRTCHAYESQRNLETARVEGLPNTAACDTYTASGATLPPEASKTSRQWHPDWHLETKVAEPRRIVTTVYNGQPDPFNGSATASCTPSEAKLPDGKPIAVVCKRVEQATTDADGSKGFSAALTSGVAPRQWRYTYNRYGQLLSEDGPRTDVADVTRYEYHPDTTADWTQGDLKQVSDPAGQVTRYTQYNPHGQVLKQIDANGIVTDYSYEPRQRLSSVTVNGQRTQYEYEPTGLLKKVTQPDGSTVVYGYDNAHRLISIQDSLGNSVSYTLDNAGHRTQEAVKDPSGTLTRNIGRTYDALGRVQSTTGVPR